jgi:hypothetical protein
MDSQGPWTHLLMTAITLTGVGVMMWMEAPEWQRETIRRGIRHRLRQLAAAAARASGHRAMGDELGGHLDQAHAGYGITYRISRLRDRL